MTQLSLLILAAVAGLALAGFALVVLDDRSGPPIVIEDPRADATIVVAVEGAVATPGVYPLPADARVQDALTVAGGLAPDADPAALNLARRLRDEDRIVIPHLVAQGSGTEASDPGAAAAAAAPGSDRPADTERTAGALVNLNSATAADLEALPEIGPVLAQRIVDYRTEHGPFGSVGELAKVEGVSARTVEALRPLVSVEP